MSFTTPILFLIFNRPDTTSMVFDKIKSVRPKRLYIAADGPRTDNTKDTILCEAVRKIVSVVDWDCEVKTLYREQNLGCKVAVSSAIDWFFENEEEGIILEDDCLPSDTFFAFCEELLQKYKDINKIMQISGNNFQNGKTRGDGSYYFSRYNHIWGWATWRRAWQQYDVNMNSFNNFVKENKIDKIFTNNKIKNYWIGIFNKTYKSEIDTWDYQWTFSIWNLDGCAILPNTNLVKNIGIGGDSTHTSNFDKITYEMILGTINKIIHPTVFLCNKEADDYTFKLIYDTRLMRRVIKKIEKLFYNCSLVRGR